MSFSKLTRFNTRLRGDEARYAAASRPEWMLGQRLPQLELPRLRFHPRRHRVHQRFILLPRNRPVGLVPCALWPQRATCTAASLSRPGFGARTDGHGRHVRSCRAAPGQAALDRQAATARTVKIMKLNPANFAGGLFLLGAVTTATAQSTWNYFISDAGGGNSLVTWSVTGSLATAPGAVLLVSESSLAISIDAPGIYADTYLADGTPQSIPTLDGSYFQYGESDVFAPISLYSTDNASSGGNDSFGLVAPLLPHTGPGVQLFYNPGTQSALIPVDFSDFNPGTYQSEESGFNTALTVNLTVETVPEPSTPAWLAAGGLLLFLRRK